MKIKSIGKNVISGLLFVAVSFLVTGCGFFSPNTQQEVEDYVKAHVPEPASVVRMEKVDTNQGKEYRYIFKSDLRDLEFDAFSAKEIGGLGNYGMSEFYSLAVADYYKEKMRDTLSACPNSGMHNDRDAKKVSMDMYMKDEADAREIAKTIAECNVIISDQWNYTPGVEITDRNICGMGFRIHLFPKANSEEIRYTLNGKDDEETIYNELIAALP